MPLLDRVAVKTPCDVAWDDLAGDGPVRFCGLCKKNVYDLAAMTPEQADDFLALHLDGGRAPCARLLRMRPDGRLVTSQCTRGAQREHRRRFASIAVGAAAIATIAAGTVDDVLRLELVDEGDRVFVDREAVVAPFAGQAPIVATSTLGEIDVRDDDGDEAPPPPPPRDVVIPGTITLRGRWKYFP